MRNIQYQTNLVPGASLPNLSYYHMSPKEYKILQKQVGRLPQKGLICESMRLCVVSALLTLKKNRS